MNCLYNFFPRNVASPYTQGAKTRGSRTAAEAIMKRWVLAVVLGVLMGCAGARDLAQDDPKGMRDDDDVRSMEGMSDEDEDEPVDEEEEQEPDAPPPNRFADDGRIFTYYEHVKPIIDNKCGACHFDGGIGPMALTTYDEVKPHVGLVKAVTASGVMPPWRASGTLDMYEGDRRLTEDETDVLVRWVEQGAPEGEKANEPEPVAPIARGLPRVDYTLEMEEEYTPEIEPDNYRCFALEWPYDETKYITGLSVEPGRAEIVPHALVYLVQPEQAAGMIEQDAADEGPGWNCSSGTPGVAAWLTSYEPGGYGQEVPGKLGFEIKPGSVLLLQIHYNTLHGKFADKSRVDFMLEDEVDRVGRVQLLMQPTWPVGFMNIPANQPDVVHTYRGRPTGLRNDTVYDLYWVDLHMHTLGKSGGIGIIRADNPGKVEPLLEIPDWAFEWQETYILKKPIKVYPDDQLVVECHFDNTAAKQLVVDGQRLAPRDVNWGEGTTDEMCLGNILTAPEE